MNLRKTLQSILKIINFENFDKTMKAFDKGMAEFNKGMQDFGDSMGKIDKDFSKDVRKSNINAEKRAKKDRDNLDKIFGSKKQNIWSDKKSKESLF